MSDEKPKSCPFCGCGDISICASAKNMKWAEEGKPKIEFCCQCWDCGARGPIGINEQVARVTWQRRKNDD